MSIKSGSGWATFARAVFWAALVITMVMATMPNPPTGMSTPSDKVNHVIGFFVLTALHQLAYRDFGFWKRLLVMAVLGGVIELVQMVPSLHRDAEWMDWVADAGAALLASCLISLFVAQARSDREPT